MADGLLDGIAQTVGGVGPVLTPEQINAAIDAMKGITENVNSADSPIFQSLSNLAAQAPQPSALHEPEAAEAPVPHEVELPDVTHGAADAVSSVAAGMAATSAALAEQDHPPEPPPVPTVVDPVADTIQDQMRQQTELINSIQTVLEHQHDAQVHAIEGMGGGGPETGAAGSATGSLADWDTRLQEVSRAGDAIGKVEETSLELLASPAREDQLRGQELMSDTAHRMETLQHELAQVPLPGETTHDSLEYGVSPAHGPSDTVVDAAPADAAASHESIHVIEGHAVGDADDESAGNGSAPAGSGPRNFSGGRSATPQQAAQPEQAEAVAAQAATATDPSTTTNVSSIHDVHSDSHVDGHGDTHVDEHVEEHTEDPPPEPAHVEPVAETHTEPEATHDASHPDP